MRSRIAAASILPAGPGWCAAGVFHSARRIGGRTFDFSREVAVMAIVNRTPDSFFDRGSTFALDRAVNAAIAAVADGADFVDVAGVPFGGGPAVSLDEEIERVVPLVEAAAYAIGSSGSFLIAGLTGVEGRRRCGERIDVVLGIAVMALGSAIAAGAMTRRRT
jgi:hypothetical protein